MHFFLKTIVASSRESTPQMTKISQSICHTNSSQLRSPTFADTLNPESFSDIFQFFMLFAEHYRMVTKEQQPRTKAASSDLPSGSLVSRGQVTTESTS